MRLFVTLILTGLILSMVGCSGEDNSTNPNDPNDPNDPPNTVELLSVDFESTLSGWNGVPQQIDSSDSWDWDRRFNSSPTTQYHVTGTSTVYDEGSVGITSSDSTGGNKFLLFELKNGIFSTINAEGYYYDVTSLRYYRFEDITVFPIRKYSLIDYDEYDSASVSFMVKPIECLTGKFGSSIGFRIIVEGAHGIIEDMLLDSTFMTTYLGSWTEIVVDISPYTGWESDIGISFEITPVHPDYWWQFRRGSDYLDDIHNPGDSSVCAIAIDDLNIKVFPAPE